MFVAMMKTRRCVGVQAKTAVRVPPAQTLAAPSPGDPSSKKHALVNRIERRSLCAVGNVSYLSCKSRTFQLRPTTHIAATTQLRDDNQSNESCKPWLDCSECVSPATQEKRRQPSGVARTHSESEIAQQRRLSHRIRDVPRCAGARLACRRLREIRACGDAERSTLAAQSYIAAGEDLE